MNHKPFWGPEVYTTSISLISFLQNIGFCTHRQHFRRVVEHVKILNAFATKTFPTGLLVLW